MVRRSGAEAAQPGPPGKWLNTAEGWARANVLYEKTDRAPKAGSLREALFLAVWLKRQEAEAHRTRILAQGLADITGAVQGKSNVAGIFEQFIKALFPFQQTEKEGTDDKMKEMLQKHTTKGTLTFKPISMDFLQNRARTVSVPDDFAKKLAERRKASK